MADVCNRNAAPPWAIHLMSEMETIKKGINKIMALVEIDQSELDTLATNLESVKSSLESEIASLKQQLPQADLSGLNKALADLQGLEPPAPSSA